MTSALGMTFVLACAGAPKPDQVPQLTWQRDIEPIIQTRCQPCHRPGGPGPMPLMTYDDIVHNIIQVRGNVAEKVMPPARVDPVTGEKHPAGLSDAEVTTIVRWIQSGYRQR
jgi:hypothetical protein